MGQTARTTKLLLDFSGRASGGTNAGKREHLRATVDILNAARRFFLDFLLAHAEKLSVRVEVISKKTGEIRERLISADVLLTWVEFQTVETADQPTPVPDWNFTQAFPDFPTRYRRSVIKDVIGKARGYLQATKSWQITGKKKGRPGVPRLLTIPPSTLGPSPWTWMNWITGRAFFGSRSILARRGCGGTTRWCTTAILNADEPKQDGNRKAPNWC